MMGTPGKGDKQIKVPFKTKIVFNSTMMASFQPVTVNKKNIISAAYDRTKSVFGV